MTTLEKQKEEIRAACYKAHPDGFEFPGHNPIVRLSDVLLAMQKHQVAIIVEPGWLDGDEGSARLDYDGKVCLYNLRTDNLDQQNEDVVHFIHNLICDVK
jgi:hypothetical protein